MKTREDILKILAMEKPALEKQFKLRKIALFGSYAKSAQSSDSDIDILVDVDPSIGLDFVTLADHIEEVLDSHVDLVSTRAVNPRNFEVIKESLIYV